MPCLLLHRPPEGGVFLLEPLPLQCQLRLRCPVVCPAMKFVYDLPP